MNEVTKLYENAKVEQKRMCEWTCKDSEVCNTLCEHYESTQVFYPPFTTEKQIELIKWLTLNDFIDNLTITFRPFELMWVFQIYTVTEFAIEKWASRMGADMTFEKGLASLINNLWQDLTEEERKQIKNILESEVRE